MSNLEDTKPKRPEGLDEKLHDTQPRRPENFPTAPPAGMYYNDEGVPAPPRILLWGVVGLFVLGILGTVAGVFIFRDVLTPGQQVRVMDILPFMNAFLPPQPAPGDTLPAARPADEEAAQNLINSPLLRPTDEAEEEAVTTPEVTEEPTPEPTPQPDPTEEPAEDTSDTALEVAAAPVEATEITTEIPATPEPEPTAVPVEESSVPAENTILASSGNSWPLAWRNYGFQRIQQTWNNCGPASITIALSYYGWQRTQEYAAGLLKPVREDKNVSPHELVEFVNQRSDIRALTRIGGDLDLLRTLVANEFPVIIERSHMFEGYEWLGHYQTVAGYNDAQRTFVIYDSFLPGSGPDDQSITETYNEVDEHWQAFNRQFIVIYEPAREARLMQLLGNRADPIDAAEHALLVAQQEARANPLNPYAWFNLGTSLTELGRYHEAANAYDQAINIGLPWRMLWYQFGPFKANYEIGRYEDVLNYVNNNLNNGGEYVEETYYWQGRVFAAQGRTQEAANAFRTALRRNNLFIAARDALDELNS